MTRKTTGSLTQAKAEARSLVKRLRRSNQVSARRGGVVLPDDEYVVLEEELTRRLLKRAA
jgi:hydrogenase maturation factor